MTTSFGCSLCQDILPNDPRRRNELHGSSCVDINKVKLWDLEIQMPLFATNVKQNNYWQKQEAKLTSRQVI